MSKIAVICMEKEYPFGAIKDYLHENRLNGTVVKQIIRFQSCERSKIFEKAKLAKKLKNPHLIQVLQTFEEENSLHIIYEQVQQAPVDWKNENMVSQISLQMKHLAAYFINSRIRVKIEPERMRFHRNGGLKYFIGLAFYVQQSRDGETLQLYYQEQLQKIFSIEMMASHERNILSFDRALKQTLDNCNSSKTIYPSMRVRLSLINEQINSIKSQQSKFRDLKNAASTPKSHRLKKFPCPQQNEQVSKNNHRLSQSSSIEDSNSPKQPNEGKSKNKITKFSMQNASNELQSNQKQLNQRLSHIEKGRKTRETMDYRTENFFFDDIEAVKHKSKIQSIYQQFIEVAKLQENNHLRDFLNVLEDAPGNDLNETINKTYLEEETCTEQEVLNKQPILEKLTNISRPSSVDENDFDSWDACELKMKVKQAINNSKMALLRVRNLTK